MLRKLPIAVLAVALGFTLGACSSLPGIADNQALIPDVCTSIPPEAVAATLGTAKPGKPESRITELQKVRSCSWDSGTGVSLDVQVTVHRPDDLRTPADQYLGFAPPAKNNGDDPRLPPAQTAVRPTPEFGPSAFIRTDVAHSVRMFDQTVRSTLTVNVRIDAGTRSITVSAYWADADPVGNDARVAQMLRNAESLLSRAGAADQPAF